MPRDPTWPQINKITAGFRRYWNILIKMAIWSFLAEMKEYWFTNEYLQFCSLPIVYYCIPCQKRTYDFTNRHCTSLSWCLCSVSLITPIHLRTSDIQPKGLVLNKLINLEMIFGLGMKLSQMRHFLVSLKSVFLHWIC